MVEDEPSLCLAASEVEYARTIALADCYTRAVARLTGSAAFSAAHGKELVEEVRKRPFEERIIFLD